MQYPFYPTGLGIPTPPRPDQHHESDHQYLSDPPISIVREGNRAIPVQPMYCDLPEGDEQTP